MMPESPSDRALVQSYLRQRGERAFRQLYRRHTPALYRFAVLRVGQPAAEEVVQETWVRAARQLQAFQWRSSLRSWLTGITLNCCRESSRKRTHSDSEIPLPDPIHANSPTLGLDLARALATLPERAREVVLLHDVQGFTHLEVGEALGIEAGTSKSQLSRARATLRAALDRTGAR